LAVESKLYVIKPRQLMEKQGQRRLPVHMMVYKTLYF